MLHLFQCGRGDEAEVSATWRRPRGLWLELSTRLMEIDLLLAEGKRASTGTEDLLVHAEHPRIEGDGPVDVGDREHKVIETVDFHEPVLPRRTASEPRRASRNSSQDRGLIGDYPFGAPCRGDVAAVRHGMADGFRPAMWQRGNQHGQWRLRVPADRRVIQRNVVRNALDREGRTLCSTQEPPLETADQPREQWDINLATSRDLNLRLTRGLRRQRR